jgi:hypothetical protein
MYYLGYILATHGRKNPLRRKAYELKKMQNLKMWIGSVVDKFMEKTIIPLIQEKKQLDFPELALQCVALAKSQFFFSQCKVYTDSGLTKAEADSEFCILDIHELSKPYTEIELAEAYNTILQVIEGIPNIQMPNGKLLITFLKECQTLHSNVTNWSTTIEHSRVVPQIDLLAYHNFKPVIIDWKLSESYVSDYSRQLVICGIVVYSKVKEKLSCLEDIKLYEVNLLKGTSMQHEFNQDRYNDLTDYINLTGNDFDLLYAKYEDAEVDNFEPTENEISCKLCNFRTLCTYLLLNNNQYDEKAYNEFVRADQFANS